MTFAVGDLVRERGKSGTYRVHGVKGQEISVFGGTRRQWRTLQADNLRACDKREAAAFLRAEVGLLEAARGIKPARPVKGKRTQT